MQLQTLDFNVLDYKDANQEVMMQTLIMTMFYELDVARIFKIPEVTLARHVFFPFASSDF